MSFNLQDSFDKITIEKSNLDNVLSDHKDHTDWLQAKFGENAVKSYISKFENLFEGIKDGTTISIPMKQIGNIRISLFTYSSDILPTPSDPITLVFTANANADTVTDYLQNKIFPPWLDTGLGCASPQWIRVENPANSGKSKWVKMLSSRAIGGCALIRSHMRFFDAGFDSTSQVGNCCVGGVHYEEWEVVKLNHVIKDWNNSRKFMENLFTNLPTPMKTSTITMQQPINIQNIPYDGNASVIQLV